MKKSVITLLVVFLTCLLVLSITACTSGSKITMAEFNEIEHGMSYKEVVEIIGSSGEMLSEVGKKGSDLYTVVYMWEGSGKIGANANIMFQGDEVTTKAQFGLK